jgi:iodotyrosine deiodinase
MTGPILHPLEFEQHGEAEMLARARNFRALMKRRRTVRDFSDRPVPRQLIEDAVMTARTSSPGPSPASRMPP